MPQHRMRVSSCVDVLSAAVAQLNETDMNSERAFEHVNLRGIRTNKNVINTLSIQHIQITGGPRDTRYLLYADSEIRGFLHIARKG